MRRLLRRLAWLVARLLLVVVLSFMVLAKATESPLGNTADSCTDRIEESGLPLLLNLRPRDLESRVNAIVDRISQTGSEKDLRELARLGGATFPILLPRLASLEEKGRLRLAWALLPIAQRMTWRGAADAHSEEQAYAFLVDAWKERSVDFQPAIVARWVERLADRGTDAMFASVAEYDTYALSAIIAALPDVASPADDACARRLLSAIYHATGRSWSTAEPTTPEGIRHRIDHWRRWWNLHASEYTVAKGPSRWSAMLKQTQFGQWTLLALNFGFGTTRAQLPVARAVLSPASRSALLLFAASLGTVTAVLLRSWWCRHRSRSHRHPYFWYLLGSLPHVSVIAVLAQFGRANSLLSAGLAAFVALALLAPFSTDPLVFRAHAPDRFSSILTSPIDSMFAMLSCTWQFAGHSWPFLLTFVFVVEKAFGVDGLGRACVNGFRTRDLHLLMGTTTLTALGVLLVEYLVQLKNAQLPAAPAAELPP